jgi:hypothetical protein
MSENVHQAGSEHEANNGEPPRTADAQTQTSLLRGRLCAMASWGVGGSDRTWAYSFGERPWVEIRSFLGGMADSYPNFRYMIDVIDSVIDSGADDLLAGGTSMQNRRRGLIGVG